MTIITKENNEKKRRTKVSKTFKTIYNLKKSLTIKKDNKSLTIKKV